MMIYTDMRIMILKYKLIDHAFTADCTKLDQTTSEKTILEQMIRRWDEKG